MKVNPSFGAVPFKNFIIPAEDNPIDDFDNIRSNSNEKWEQHRNNMLASLQFIAEGGASLSDDEIKQSRYGTAYPEAAEIFIAIRKSGNF